MLVWMDGAIVDDAEARVSPFDHGLLTGDGIFETLRVRDGAVFAARRHLERLHASAKAMGLTLRPDDELRKAMDDLVRASGVSDGRMRITVTGGASPLGSERGDGGPTTIVACGPIPSWPATTDVCVVPWPRNERGALAGVKSTSYGENVIALAYAKERGCGEAIFPNLAGNLCEGTGSNVFLAVQGQLVTPPLSSGCLAGVTRALVIETAGAVEADVPASALAEADEAFITSTTRDIQPIAAVDGHPLPDAPGPLTKAAMAAFPSSGGDV
jgi:branched-chain amino acid aminotransferase